MEPRKARISVLYNDNPFLLHNKVENMSYTDNAEGSSDDITLDLDYNFNGQFVPAKESIIDVMLYFDNWENDKNTETYHCGTFVLDDITYSGPPNMMSLKGVAAPASEAFSSVPKYQSWENTTLEDIAKEKMSLYGMTKLFYNAPRIEIKKIEQNGETDSGFLKSICEKYNLCLKIYKMGLVIFAWEVYEENLQPSAVLSVNDLQVKSYSWNSTTYGTYTGVHLRHTTKKIRKQEPQTFDITLGAGPRMLELTDSVETEQEAIEIARQKLNAANMDAVTLSLDINPNVFIFASNKIRIINSGCLNGDYMVKKVTHNISGTGGHSSSLECYKMFQRF